MSLRSRAFAVRIPPIICLSAVFALAGCSDNGGLPPGPSSPPGPFARLPIESIAAVADYAGTSGIDGRTFELTDPAACEALREELTAATAEQRQEMLAAVAGRLCISRAESTIEGDNAEVTVREYTSGAGWTLALQRSDEGWVVTGVGPLEHSATP